MKTWGIIPAAGRGTRLQPLAFSKELLPVGVHADHAHPRAVAEYLLERMIAAGVTHFCFIISPEKTDLITYFGAAYEGRPIAYVIQPHAAGLCDAIFRARALVTPDDELVIGLPDTIWEPMSALADCPRGRFSLLLFPTEHPEYFDAVISDPATAEVMRIEVKSPTASSAWIWGAMRLPGSDFASLHDLWQAREPRDEYLGTLINAWMQQGGHVYAEKRGREYVDVGTLEGYRTAFRQLHSL